MLQGVFVEIFSKLKDPRVERTKKNLFLDVIGLALFATLAGAQCFTEMEHFCKLHAQLLKNYFQLPCGIPSHDTFCRVFSAIDSASFQTCFSEWIKSVIEIFPENVIPIDGKSIRASRRTKADLKALHIVSAFSCANGISLGQMIVDKKTNEITVIPELLKKLCIEGAIITLDAMGCQTGIAEQIIEQKGDYILRLKENQGGLLEEINDTFKEAEKAGYKNMTHYTATDEVNNNHGRIEGRKCIVLPLMYFMMLKSKWKGLQSLVLIISERETHAEKTIEYRYYISSLDPKDPQKIMSSIRTHWQIENNLHWLLDVAYRQDQSRIRDENTALNVSWLKKTALGLLKRATNIKGSIRRKQLALWAKPENIIEIVQN
ncbi:MAG: ISAs1 family transposase [Gammaproteobacteria bacterium]|nr:ISAs1 family transposase [Gammaproteobacteria bacterium]